MNWTDILPWPLSAWYKLRLAYDRNSFSFVIEIHCLAQAYLLNMLRERPDRLKMMEEKFGVPTFIMPRKTGGWGFGEILTLTNPSGGEWLIWRCQLPRNYEGGKEALYAVAATLESVFCFLRFFTNPANYYLSQLLLVEIALRKGESAVGIILSPDATKWISNLGDRGYKYDPVLDAMKAAYSTMIGYNRETDFRVELQNPEQIYFSVPGDRCHLAADPSRSEVWQEGVFLHPNHIEAPIQLLSLLAGVSQLYLKANQGIHLMKFKDRIQEALEKGGLQIRSEGMGPDFTIISDIHGLIGGIDGELRLSDLQGLFEKRGEIV